VAGFDGITRWVKSSPNQLLGIVVSLVVIGAALWTGVRARSTAADLATKRRGWEAMAGQLATVQQQFKVPSSTESSVLITEANRMSALGVPADEKLNLVEMLGHLAEAFSLSSVRVSVITRSDSAVVPVRQVVGSAIKPASYAIAVEFVGRFVDAQKFVSSLPPSVSLSRMHAARRDSGALYQLILSVYEIDANPGD
jgi:hypothetical protein